MGHVEEPLGPIITVADLPNLSVLERFKCRRSDSVLMVTSLTDKCRVALKQVDDGDVYSLARKNPKNARVKAAQYASLSRDGIRDNDSSSLMVLRSEGVMGCRFLDAGVSERLMAMQR